MVGETVKDGQPTGEESRVQVPTDEELGAWVAAFCQQCDNYTPDDPLCEPSGGLEGARVRAWQRGFCPKAVVAGQTGLMTDTGFIPGR